MNYCVQTQAQTARVISFDQGSHRPTYYLYFKYNTNLVILYYLRWSTSSQPKPTSRQKAKLHWISFLLKLLWIKSEWDKMKSSRFILPFEMWKHKAGLENWLSKSQTSCTCSKIGFISQLIGLLSVSISSMFFKTELLSVTKVNSIPFKSYNCVHALSKKVNTAVKVINKDFSLNWCWSVTIGHFVMATELRWRLFGYLGDSNCLKHR